MNIYKEELMDHYRHPRNYGVIDKPDFEYTSVNALCGDTIQITGSKQDTRIIDIKFKGSGCVISQASASLLTEFVKGKDICVVKEMTPQAMLEIVGITLGPNRIRCALLVLEALKQALNEVSISCN